MKLAILGKGTAGALALNHFNSYTDYEIDLYYDSSIKEQTVGEGTTLHIPTRLNYTLGVTWEEIRKLNGTVKTGIYYDGWSETNYFHSFYLPAASIHIDAIKLQEYLLAKNKCNLINKNVNINDVDADYVIDCSGRPTDYSDYTLTENINVNAVCVLHYKPITYFDYTLCKAMERGWMFGIPLQDRVSFGYLYNTNISNKDEVYKEMFKYLKKEGYNNPTKKNFFEFKNYYRKENFVEDIACNGNSSFFLEPLEATSLALVDRINRWTWDLLNNNITQQEANMYYKNYIKEIEMIINLHYLDPKQKTKFWNYAKQNSSYILNDQIYKKIVDNLENDEYFFDDFGTWNKDSFKQNLKGLNLI